MESRFLPKLQIYLIEKLHRSQTGFVPRMGVHINIERAVKRIRMRTENNRACYGLYIDFANAYNSVPQTLLFEKLRKKNIFEEEEIKYLEQLYVRYRIRVGEKIIATNKGVAQGSLISPSLFNIFIEDLGQELQEKADLNIEDILMYADDILTICSSISQLRRAIEVIDLWCLRNGMKLNKDKSGVVVFSARKSQRVPLMKKDNTCNSGETDTRTFRNLIPTTRSIEGIPICPQYKYLGTWMNTKLTCGPQIQQIKKKASFLFVKLYPFLVNASADARRDMFMTMVAPLFNSILILMEHEPSNAQKKNVNTLWKVLFKQFLFISKRTNSILVEEMIGKHLEEVAMKTSKSSRSKWEARRDYGTIPINVPSKSVNKLRAVPNSWCRLVNTMVQPCPSCNVKGVVCDRWHLKYTHNLSLPHVNRIWREEIVPESIATDKGLPRRRIKIREKVNDIIDRHLKEFEEGVERLQRR